MFPLVSGGTPPADLAHLEAQLEQGLARHFELPASAIQDRLVVVGAGSTLESLTSLRIDLRGAELDLIRRADDKSASFRGLQRVPGVQPISIARLEVGAPDMTISGRPVDLSMTATDVELAYAMSEPEDSWGSSPILRWVSGTGHYRMAAAKRDVEFLVNKLIAHHARKKRISTRDFTLPVVRSEGAMLALQFRLKAQFLLSRYDITVDARTQLRTNLTTKVVDAILNIDGLGGEIIELLFQGAIDKLKADQEGFSTFLFPVEIDREHDSEENRLTISGGDTLVVEASFS